MVEPADAPIEAELHFNLDEQIEAGLENRLELGQQQERIASSETAIKVAKNNLLPTLNLQGSVTVDGVGHDLAASYDKHHSGAGGSGWTGSHGQRAARLYFLASAE